MHKEALEKVVKIAEKSPKILLSPSFFEKICTRLGVETSQAGDEMVFSREGHEAAAVIITAKNCSEHKCVVQEGKSGIRIFEFIKATVELLSDEIIPPSPYEKIGQTAVYYCDRGTAILRREVLGNGAQ